MIRSNLVITLVVVGAAGCGFGGGGGGGGSVSPISSGPIGSANYLPKQVTRSSSYQWNVLYQPNQAAGGAITAAIAPFGTDVFVGISPLGRIDYLSSAGQTTEVSLVFDVGNFAALGSSVFAATGNVVANRAGQIYVRDFNTMTWNLALDGSLKQAVALDYMAQILAFQGENDGRTATVSSIDSAGNTREVAWLGSMVPMSVVNFNGEAWVGGRSNNSKGGPAKLFHGNGTTFTEVTVPSMTNFGQIASVPALAVANGVLFIAVEVKDAVQGTTLGGNLYYLDGKGGLTGINAMQNDAPVSLIGDLDGTIYAGTRSGKLQWLDEKGNWNAEAGFPTNLGVTCLVAPGAVLDAGVRGANGAELLQRIATGTQAGNGVSFTAITPATGPQAGGTPVTISGNGFAGVTAVTLGGTALTNLKVVSDVQITGTTAAGTGTADLKITNAKGTFTQPGAFSYAGASLSFATDIQPLFTKGVTGNSANQCTWCHTATAGANLKGSGAAFAILDTYAGAMAEVNKGMLIPKITTGTMSVHVQPNTADGTAMTQADVTKVQNWVSGGAKP